MRSFHGLAVVCAFLLWVYTVSASPNDVDDTVLLCGIDPDLSELLAEAGRRSLAHEEATAIKIYLNVLSIRPNCWDVHTGLALSYAVIGENSSSDEHLKKAESLKEKWEAANPAPRKPLQRPVTESRPVRSEPPKTERINYWKWLFISSVIKR